MPSESFASRKKGSPYHEAKTARIIKRSSAHSSAGTSSVLPWGEVTRKVFPWPLPLRAVCSRLCTHRLYFCSQLSPELLLQAIPEARATAVSVSAQLLVTAQTSVLAPFTDDDRAGLPMPALLRAWSLCCRGPRIPYSSSLLVQPDNARSIASARSAVVRCGVMCRVFISEGPFDVSTRRMSDRG